ncbi:Casein kinase substrate, phosphoprotein PP28 [Corchorus olitorius]|uniref:Casein kinase substrate, phosphoprotein PP28 n=1 Tax=Corchorus olitorius TaxID=93759 RepID=A0A1R3H4U2_9ROSI|nr:Casein kinase substrate, phosphoprotein PP28 [Corchorus olitorius]
MARGKSKPKRTGQRTFSTMEEIQAKYKEEEESEEYEDEYSDDETEQKQKRKGVEGLIEINNPNLVKPKNVKLKFIDFSQIEKTTTELSRREREELGKERAAEQREKGKTTRARKDLAKIVMSEHPKKPEPPQNLPPPSSTSKSIPEIGNGGAAGFSGQQRWRYPNPPEVETPDPATLRDQWRYAIRQYSKWYSHAWGTAILAGVSFFALGWIIKGSNPLPSFKSDDSDKKKR